MDINGSQVHTLMARIDPDGHSWAHSYYCSFRYALMLCIG